MNGVLYGIGVGPGDPELLTLKGARLIRECDLIAVPDSGMDERIALDIVREHIAGKQVVFCKLPMVRDELELAKSREIAADLLCKELDSGKNIAFLTLGDVTIYSTYLYLHEIITARGYHAEMVAGVPSFCAAAAALGVGLCEAEQSLHIYPASYPGTEKALQQEGIKVLMKSGKKLEGLVALLRQENLLSHSAMVERVGMAGERLVSDMTDFEGESGYLSTVIVKGNIKDK